MPVDSSSSSPPVTGPQSQPTPKLPSSQTMESKHVHWGDIVEKEGVVGLVEIGFKHVLNRVTGQRADGEVRGPSSNSISHLGQIQKTRRQALARAKDQREHAHNKQDKKVSFEVPLYPSTPPTPLNEYYGSSDSSLDTSGRRSN